MRHCDYCELICKIEQARTSNRNFDFPSLVCESLSIVGLKPGRLLRDIDHLVLGLCVASLFEGPSLHISLLLVAVYCSFARPSDRILVRLSPTRIDTSSSFEVTVFGLLRALALPDAHTHFHAFYS